MLSPRFRVLAGFLGDGLGHLISQTIVGIVIVGCFEGGTSKSCGGIDVGVSFRRKLKVIRLNIGFKKIEGSVTMVAVMQVRVNSKNLTCKGKHREAVIVQKMFIK